MIDHTIYAEITMSDDLDKAQRHWRQRSLFKRQRRRWPWLRIVMLTGGTVALVLWQEEVLAWLAVLVG